MINKPNKTGICYICRKVVSIRRLKILHYNESDRDIELCKKCFKNHFGDIKKWEEDKDGYVR